MAHDTHDTPGLPMTSELKLALELAKLAGATIDLLQNNHLAVGLGA